MWTRKPTKLYGKENEKTATKGYPIWTNYKLNDTLVNRGLT